MYLRKQEEETLLLLNKYFTKYNCKTIDYCLLKNNGVFYINNYAFVITIEDKPNYIDICKSLKSLRNKGYINCNETIFSNTKEILPSFKKVCLTDKGYKKTKEINSSNIFVDFTMIVKKLIGK